MTFTANFTSFLSADPSTHARERKSNVCMVLRAGPEMLSGAIQVIRLDLLLMLLKTVPTMPSVEGKLHRGLVRSCFPIPRFGNRFLILVCCWAGWSFHLLPSEVSAGFSEEPRGMGEVSVAQDLHCILPLGEEGVCAVAVGRAGCVAEYK